MEFPNHLLNIVREGRGVLLLGSGSSFGCVDSAGDGPPDGEGLKDMLCDRFLGGAMKDSPLSIVSELAIS